MTSSANTPGDRDIAGKRGFYSPQIDGLRFVAALLVFVHHAPTLPLLGTIKTYGWVGVDLFLAISAYLITHLIILEFRRTDTIALRSFFIRRALRIWPLYLVFATFACALSVATGASAPGETLGWWLSHLSFTNNVMTAVMGYSPVLFSQHLWTITLEEQAYLVMPLVLFAFLRSGASSKAALWAGAAFILVLMVARLALAIVGVEHPFIWVLPLRADPFIVGALAAILLANREAVTRPILLMAGGAALLCSVALFPSVETVGYYQVFGYTIVALACTAIVIAAQSDRFLTILGNRPMAYLGKISYGIYVYHLAALFAATRALELAGMGSSLAIFVLALLLTIVTAAISYRVLEKPFLKLKERFAVVQSRPS